MKSIIKGSLISVATCAVILSLQGCGKDRAGISVAEANNLGSNSISGLNNAHCGKGTKDQDCDYIPDEKEGGSEYPFAVPGESDSDDDGLSDGCEYGVAEAIRDYPICKKLSVNHTDPRNPDTDGDGIKDGDELKKNVGSSYITDPTDPDSDDDGLEDGVETGDKPGSDYKTNPLNPDTDGDMLSDGVELETAIKTNPLEIDTDHDGVTDGIEVCGTVGGNGYGTGKVTSVSSVNIDIVDGTDYYTDKLDSLVNHFGGNTDCSTPANTNSTDKPNVIDAKDPTNDSDGDERPNDKEKAKGKDPLDFGNNYPWITDTPKGQDMLAKGFVYIPKANGIDGFWMSKYEAKYKADHSVGVDFNNTTSVISYNANSDVDDDKIDANNRLDDYKNDNTNYSAYYLPTQKQYQNLYLLKDGTFDGNGCLTIENKNGDANIPKSYTGLICDLKQNDELVKNLINATHYIDNNNEQKFGSSGHSISFRATTTTIPELSYLP